MNNTLNICKTCRKPKAHYNCGICQECTCKSCTQFLGEETFSFLKKVPAELTHSNYCNQCYEEKVQASLDEYNHKMEAAREIYIFTKEQSKQTRLLQRKEMPYKVENCDDQEEALMRMSFQAVEGGFNALIDIQFTSKKVVSGSHKKLVWSATAIPVTIDPDRVSGY